MGFRHLSVINDTFLDLLLSIEDAPTVQLQRITINLGFDNHPFWKVPRVGDIGIILHKYNCIGSIASLLVWTRSH